MVSPEKKPIYPTHPLSEQIQKFLVDLPGGNKVVLGNEDQVRILNSIIASGEQGVSTTKLAKPYTDAGFLPPSARRMLGYKLNSIGKHLPRNCAIVNVTPRTENIKGKEAVYVYVEVKRNLTGVSEIKSEDTVDSAQSPKVTTVAHPNLETLALQLGDKKVVVPRKELYGIADIALAIDNKNSRDVYNKVYTVRKDDPSIETKVLKVGRYRKIYFQEADFKKLALAILEKSESDKSKAVRSAVDIHG